MTNPKHNGNGAKEVAPATATTTKTPAVPKPLTDEQKADMERKAQIEAQRQHFDGLFRLTNMRQRYEEHKAAIQKLNVPDDELEQFEGDRYSNTAITIEDYNARKYEIKHPYLVKQVCEFIAAHFDQRIAECEDKILNYGK